VNYSPFARCAVAPPVRALWTARRFWAAAPDIFGFGFGLAGFVIVPGLRDFLTLQRGHARLVPPLHFFFFILVFNLSFEIC
jgi:hypothetical protein